jgi:hypothetical protein
VYFKELVRYIHLNPIRRNLIKDIEALNTFPYSGHATLMGKHARPWQNTRFVLSGFGKGIPESHQQYLAVRDLGYSRTDLAKRLGMTQPAVDYAVDRGKQIAKKMDKS